MKNMLRHNNSISDVIPNGFTYRWYKKEKHILIRCFSIKNFRESNI